MAEEVMCHIGTAAVFCRADSPEMTGALNKRLSRKKGFRVTSSRIRSSKQMHTLFDHVMTNAADRCISGVTCGISV